MSARGGKARKHRSQSQAAKSRALNAKYRHEAAQLKSLGVLSGKVNARKNITRSTRTKINKFREVLEGKAIAVPAPKQIRQKYTDKELLREQGRFLLVPKQYENQRAKISRGMVNVTRPLKNGQEEYIILPFKYNDIDALIKGLRTDSSEVNALKEPDELFTYRLFGHNANASFPDAESMAEGLEHYRSKFGRGLEEVQFFTFQRFQGYPVSGGNVRPSKEKKFYGSVNSKGRNYEETGTLLFQRRNRDKIRKQRERKYETEADRAVRLEKQRIRSAQNRQRKFLEK